ncbi:MAG: hypothetical protein Q8O86_12985 [Dehalococcoidia bacterium]|nr:hypothetical protein [Dehalococcoidia bacterium]
MVAKKAQVFAVAWYRKEEWDDLLKVSEDRDDLEATYEEWLVEGQKFLKRLRSAGMEARKVDVDVRELVRYCKEQGLPVNGESRANYAAEALVKQPR